MTRAASVAPDEIRRFSAQAEEWWNADGAFRALHRVNPLRVAYGRDQILAHTGRDSLRGVNLLDVGCGGGLLAEPLARLGARVTGLDASARGIEAARDHAKISGLDIDYRVGSVESLAQEKTRYDVITAMEIVEHVANVDVFLKALAVLLKPNGLLLMSTFNRTTRSYLMGILAAEYVLGWVPAGTHDWDKFLRPSELVGRLEKQRIKTTDLTGLAFNPWRGAFETNKGRLGVNYMLTGVKDSVSSEA